jgi:hypothetical protein
LKAIKAIFRSKKIMLTRSPQNMEVLKEEKKTELEDIS